MSDKQKIMLVDDDEHILRSLQIYLKMENYDVVTATRGKEALDKIGEDRPDLIVLDVMMPEMDGFEVLDVLKGDAGTAKIPVIMLTAKGQDVDVLKGYQKGAASYMTKPFNLNELVENIQLIFQTETENAG